MTSMLNIDNLQCWQQGFFPPNIHSQPMTSVQILVRMWSRLSTPLQQNPQLISPLNAHWANRSPVVQQFFMTSHITKVCLGKWQSISPTQINYQLHNTCSTKLHRKRDFCQDILDNIMDSRTRKPTKTCSTKSHKNRDFSQDPCDNIRDSRTIEPTVWHYDSWIQHRQRSGLSSYWM
jgi:hypothetical protein